MLPKATGTKEKGLSRRNRLVQERLIRTDTALRARNLQVHDELLFDTPPNEVEESHSPSKQKMESVVTLSILIVAEVGQGSNRRVTS